VGKDKGIMKMWRSLIAVAALLTTVSCNDILGDNDGNFAFEVIPLIYDPELTEGVEINVFSQTIQLDGILVLPNACHDVTGDQQISGNTINFKVTATPRGTCNDVIQMQQYRAQLLSLDRGTYRVRVTHQLGTAAARVMADADVTI
jgi:hypothetical protein